MLSEFRTINTEERLAQKYYFIKIGRKFFTELLQAKTASEPIMRFVKSKIKAKQTLILRKRFDLWRRFCLENKRKRISKNAALSLHRETLYAAFFDVLKKKTENHRGPKAKVPELKGLVKRRFFKQWLEAYGTRRITKIVTGWRRKLLLQKCFRELKRFHGLKKRFYQYQMSKAHACVKKTWGIMRSVFHARMSEQEQLDKAGRYYRMNLLTKALFGLTGACEKRKTEITKLILFRKKSGMKVKRVFFDILNIKRKKAYYVQMLLKQIELRMNPLKLRTYFNKFMEGIFLRKTKKKLISLALKARMTRIQALVFAILKRNVQCTYQKYNEAIELNQRRSRALLMKSFFCWKFSARDKKALAGKTSLLAEELNKKKMKGVFRR